MSARIRRRTFLGSTLALGGGWCAGVQVLAACSKPDARADALRALIEHVVMPDARDVMRRSQELAAQAAVMTVVTAGEEPRELERMRAAWKSAALAWARMFAFRQGPFVESSALLRASCWPVRTRSIAELIASAQPIDAQRIEALGADMKGLYAIEALLFGAPSPEAKESWLHGNHRPRALAFIKEAANQVQHYGELASSQVLRGDGDYVVDALAKKPQASLSALVNQMIETCETAAAGRIDVVHNAQVAGTLGSVEIQAKPSGLSSQIPRTWIEALARQLAELRPLVHAASPDAERWTQAAFDRALHVLSALNAPLEVLAASDPQRLLDAARETRALEVALKSQLARALGVTLTFVSGDGD